MTRCATLDEVRTNIDRLDAQIVALLAERQGFVAQAAGFKPHRAAVVVPERIEAIIVKVRALADQHHAAPDLIETIYRAMIDAYIGFEGKQWDIRHGGM
jgi:isochorismate pyruvate lyase